MLSTPTGLKTYSNWIYNTLGPWKSMTRLIAQGASVRFMTYVLFCDFKRYKECIGSCVSPSYFEFDLRQYLLSFSFKDLKNFSNTKFHKLCLESFSIYHGVFSTQSCVQIWQTGNNDVSKNCRTGNILLPRGCDPYDQHQEIIADQTWKPRALGIVCVLQEFYFLIKTKLRWR